MEKSSERPPLKIKNNSEKEGPGFSYQILELYVFGVTIFDIKKTHLRMRQINYAIRPIRMTYEGMHHNLSLRH